MFSSDSHTLPLLYEHAWFSCLESGIPKPSHSSYPKEGQPKLANEPRIPVNVSKLIVLWTSDVITFSHINSSYRCQLFRIFLFTL